ncbi:MAG: type ISP restriction/modification enzyme, partial [Limisphaerales bacterium]
AGLMRHFLAGGNLGLITTRQTKEGFGAFATDIIAGHKSCAAYDINTVFPLYLYPNGESEAQAELVSHENGRRPNLSAGFVKQLTQAVGLEFVADGHGDLKKKIRASRYFQLFLCHSSFSKLPRPLRRIPQVGLPSRPNYR